MKKILFFLTVIGVFNSLPAEASLWGYYAKKGLNLPRISARKPLAERCKVFNYKGLKTQNIALEACLRASQDDFLGAAPTPTSSAKRMYVESPDWQLFNGAAAADATLTLDDLEDIYGNEVTMADLGDKGYGRINPDGISESITFTGITTNSDGTKTLTGVRTVLAKYPYTETSGLTRSHSIGSLFRLSNTAGFYNDLGNKLNDETIEGEWIFSTTTSKGICFINTNFCLRSNSSTLQWTTDDWVNSYNFTSSSISTLSASTTQGINITNSEIAVIVSTTLGMAFGSDGRLYQKTSSTLAIENDSNGIKINTTTLSPLLTALNNVTSLNGIATTTPKTNYIPLGSASGTISQTWIATSTGDGVNGNFLRSTSTGVFYDSIGSTGGASTTATHAAVDTSYRNTSTLHNGKALLVVITIALNGGSGTNGQADIYMSSSSQTGAPVTTLVGRTYLNNDGGAGVSNSGYQMITLIVPSNFYWMVDNITNSSINNIYEMEL